MIDLTGKTAFITGASRGIGEAAARQLAHYGANVALCARSSTDIRRIAAELGANALAVTADVAVFPEVQKAIDDTVAHFGGLDMVVNNAGVIDPIARLEQSDPSAWGQAIDINVKGVYHCMQAAYPHLVKDAGLIVNLSSGAATGALEGWSHYCASKAAVLSLTRCAHKEWAPLGIRVVGLSPGTVATDMQHVIRDSGVNPVSELDWSAHISPQWVAEAIAWLTQDASREFDGGDFSLKTDAGRRAVGLIP